MVALTPSGGVADLPELRSRPRERLAAVSPEPSGASLKEMVDDYERAIIARCLERCSGNRSAAARELGITRQGLSLKLTKFGL
jgi:DNA-binding NtrC family response regulator